MCYTSSYQHYYTSYPYLFVLCLFIKAVMYHTCSSKTMIAFVWTILWMFSNTKCFTIVMCKCWILLDPVLWAVDRKLHLTLPSMNRLNETEPATFSVLSFLNFFRNFVFCFVLIYYKRDLKQNVLLSTFILPTLILMDYVEKWACSYELELIITTNKQTNKQTILLTQILEEWWGLLFTQFQYCYILILMFRNYLLYYF
jgi:hypothetical protein